MVDISFENEWMSRIITNRNKLVNDLLELPSLSRSDFAKGLKLRRQDFANDKAMWDELLKSKNGLSVY